MPTLKIMTKEHGDMKFAVNPADKKSVAEAENMFNEFMGKKYLAYKKTDQGNEKISAFDPEDDIIMSPQHIGG